MAARAVLVIVACTFGLISGRIVDLNLGVVEEGGDVVGVRSHRLSLRCSPLYSAQVVWTHNEILIPKGDPRRYVAENGSLIITKIVHNKKKGENDAGLYQCKVSNANGAILSTPIKLSIAGIAHEFTTSPNNTTVVEGNFLRLTCHIESTPPANITWVKDGAPLHSNKRYTVTESGLYITNVKPEDAGFYACSAANLLINKIRTSQTGQVVVVKQSTQNVQLLLPDQSLNPSTFRLGETNILICAASGVPRPNVKWIRSRPDGANSTLITTYNGLNIFTIQTVALDDRGLYTCTATQTINGITSSVSKNLNVDVEVPPVIVEKPKSQVFPAAKTVRIECEAQGNPTPQIVWYKDGAKLHINGRIKQRVKELVLGAVVTQDTGVYQCFASSSAGVAWAAGRLVVNSPIDQPAPPTGLKCKTVSSTQVSLSWNQLVNPDFKAFSVHYFPTDGGDEGKDVTVNDTFVVDKLQPHTNYTFYIRSYSGKSASEQSKRIVCKTAESVPIGVPQAEVTATGPHCLTVEWTPPPLAVARGTIVAYEIQWKRLTQSSFHVETLPRGTFRYVIPGLRERTEYAIRVLGATTLGWPELAENQAPWLKAQTAALKLSSLPSPSFQVYLINSSTVEVMWKLRENVTIDGVKLSYRSNADATTTTFQLQPIERSHFIHFPEATKWFEFSVVAYRSTTDGPDCLVRYNLDQLPTSKAAPSAPTDVDAVPLSQVAINLTWFSPPDSSSPLSRYRVQFAPRRSPPHISSLQYLETNNTFAVMTELKPQTYYKMFVQAVSPTGELSAASSTVGCKTFPEVVGSVGGIGWKIVSNSSVQVTWDPMPFPVTQYTVFFSSRPVTEPVELWNRILVPQNVTFAKLTDLRNNVDYVAIIRAESVSSHGPLSSETYISFPLGENSPDGHKDNVSSDQFLGILVGVSISLCCISLCTGSLLYRKKCNKPQDQVPSSLTENGQCSAQCVAGSLASIEMKNIHPTSPVNGLKLPLISNGTIPNGNNKDKFIRITDNPQGGRGERSSSHSTDEGDSLLSGPELDVEPEETTQIRLLVDSSLLVLAPLKETAPDDGFHETHISTQHW